MTVNTPVICCKRVYLPAASDDGLRVLVERLWPRGVSKDVAAIDHWLKDVAPSAELRRWYGHDAERWEDFYRRYTKELATNEAVDRLLQWARKGKLTLVYSARDEPGNSAQVLHAYLSDLLDT